MGVDAVILSKGTWTEATAGNLRAYLPEGSRLYIDRDQYWSDLEPNAYKIDTSDEDKLGVVELSCGLRLYSESYPRGHWPTIANAIEAMRLTFGNVYYSGDGLMPDEIIGLGEWTKEQTDELWQVWNKQQEYEQAEQQAEHDESVLTQLEAWLVKQRDTQAELLDEVFNYQTLGLYYAYECSLRQLRFIRDGDQSMESEQ